MIELSAWRTRVVPGRRRTASLLMIPTVRVESRSQLPSGNSSPEVYDDQTYCYYRTLDVFLCRGTAGTDRQRGGQRNLLVAVLLGAKTASLDGINCRAVHKIDIHESASSFFWIRHRNRPLPRIVYLQGLALGGFRSPSPLFFLAASSTLGALPYLFFLSLSFRFIFDIILGDRSFKRLAGHSTMQGGALSVLLCAVALLVPRVEGQNPVRTFQWKFGNNYVDESFAECQTLPIIVEPLSDNSTTAGVPPYYLFAFELGGIPTVTMVGNDPNNLTWVANHKQGTTLMLTMMDSNQSTGGIPSNLYTMAPGNTSCLPTPPSNPPVIHANVTDTLTTCEPWGLTITGGTKPYQIVLSALNSPTITNSSMGPNDDVFTYIDRADPNGQLMASVVDANGQWGVSSNITKTAGSTDVDCVGLVSSSQTSAEIAQEAADRARAAQAANRRRRNGLIAGLVVGLGVPILLVAFAAVWLYRRQRRPENEQGIWDNQDITPRPLNLPESGDMREVDAAPLSSKSSAFASYSPAGTPHMEVTPIPPVYFDREIAEAQQRGRSADTAASAAGSSSANSPTSGAEATALYRKAREATRGRLYPTAASAQASTQSLHGLPPTPRPPTPKPTASRCCAGPGYPT
ncbi:hypothetical protein NM688_g8648 [Phlebia brevispora]|uniref:Uncharacterized protein n=1 Tax=Phlebia brevispora TaxID=194682 RepID=A0ACC1RRY2_9APHY|nr:hypothetical protein NM688_g8648 [Phlebia brevispora]